MKFRVMNVTLLAGVVLLGTGAAPSADTTITVPANAGPRSQALNPAFDYSHIYAHLYDDNAPPVAVAVMPGSTVTVAYVSGAVSAGAGYSPVDANGEPGNVVNNANGWPSYYMNPAVTVNSMALVGTFAYEGVIVGTPLLLGNGPTMVTAPVGANQLLMGINDGGYGDNSGALTVTVSIGLPSAWTQIQNLMTSTVMTNLASNIQNQLDAKLEAAMATLEGANKNSVETAVNQLQAFVNAVTADVRGGRLTCEQAAPLVNAAQTVVATLNQPALSTRSMCQ